MIKLNPVYPFSSKSTLTRVVIPHKQFLRGCNKVLITSDCSNRWFLDFMDLCIYKSEFRFYPSPLKLERITWILLCFHLWSLISALNWCEYILRQFLLIPKRARAPPPSQIVQFSNLCSVLFAALQSINPNCDAVVAVWTIPPGRSSPVTADRQLRCE